MWIRSLVTSAALASACGPRPAPPPEKPKSYTALLEEAHQHEQEALRHEHAAEKTPTASTDFHCGDDILAAQTTSGGEPVSRWVPCWTVERDAHERHKREAARLRAEARDHRQEARNLAYVERTFCAVMPEDELAHTPFWHREDIVRVAPYFEDKVVRGAEITFRPVKGLTVAWLRAAIDCHAARAALFGYDPTYQAYDPSLVQRTRISVVERAEGMVVTIRADDSDTAALVWSKAQGLAVPRTDE
jgi:hypothetical protein